MYREDRQVVNIYTLFAGIAIFISSLGLLSISLFDIRQRYREIGLRKVNGAQAKDIYPLLIKKYLSVMGVATLLSIPLSWIAITLYLQDFAHKAPLTFDLFAIAVAITTAISLLTIIGQIRKAANINPASIMKKRIKDIKIINLTYNENTKIRLAFLDALKIIHGYKFSRSGFQSGMLHHADAIYP